MASRALMVPRAGTGGLTIRTPEAFNGLIDTIRQTGFSLDYAADVIGLSRASCESWFREDQELKREVRRARAEWMADRVDSLLEVDPVSKLLAHPKEVAWLLQKAAPETYGDKIDITARTENLVLTMTPDQVRDTVIAQLPVLQALVARAVGKPAA